MSALYNTENSFLKNGPSISVDQRKMNAVRAYWEWMPIRYYWDIRVAPCLEPNADDATDKSTWMTTCASGDPFKWASCWT
jgi:hypothetical protein